MEAHECLVGDVHSLYLCDTFASLLVMRRSTGQIHVWKVDEHDGADPLPVFCSSKAEWKALNAREVSEVQTIPWCFLVRTIDGKFLGYGRGTVRITLNGYEHGTDLEADIASVHEIDGVRTTIVVRNSDGKLCTTTW